MGEHVAAVTSTGGYAVPPHAVIVSNSALQGDQSNLNAPSSPSSSPSSTDILQIVATTGVVVGALGAGIYGYRQISRHLYNNACRDECCYKRVAEAMIDNKHVYTDDELRNALFDIRLHKFGAETQPIREAAADSVDASLENGLPPKKMVQLLNYQTEMPKLRREHAAQSTAVKRDAYAREYLRPFGFYYASNADVAKIDSKKLFPCEDVKRFVLLYAHKLAAGRPGTVKKYDGSHYVMIAHRNGDWRVYDNQNPLVNKRALLHGAATRTDAAKAVCAFARRQYKTTKDVPLVVISQERYIPPPR